MLNNRAIGVAAVLSLALTSCAGPVKKPRVDPFPLNFPLVVAGTIDIEGTVVGQPRAREGIVYYATREGYITAVVASSRGVLWRFKADNTISVSPELGQDHIVLRDDGNVLYVLDFKGVCVLRKPLGEDVTSAARENKERVYFGTAGGRVRVLGLSAGGEQLWDNVAATSVGPITAGPVFGEDLVIFGAADGRLLALNHEGKLIWEFAASGAIAVDPSVEDGHLYFGTEDRFFYCLNVATGKRKWSRRLQGAPLHPALIQGRRLAVPASNSVIYILSSRGGSVLSWVSVSSRIVHEAAVTGPLILISSAGSFLFAHDIATGKRVGQHLASGPLAAGALWVSPAVVLVVEDEGSGRQRLAFLRPQPAALSAAARGRSPGL